jgi:hypothetical protein
VNGLCEYEIDFDGVLWDFPVFEEPLFEQKSSLELSGAAD